MLASVAAIASGSKVEVIAEQAGRDNPYPTSITGHAVVVHLGQSDRWRRTCMGLTKEPMVEADLHGTIVAEWASKRWKWSICGGGCAVAVTMPGEEWNRLCGILDAQVRHRVHKALLQLRRPHQV
jgi:hypothetical protein